ncbi:MAG: nuclear transport factor 2 family protein [Mesorhizobium sp.]|nr:MAG: nuclear transport factor 2 family protein [Mesorhizobium sp.]TIV27047.1 MAG: nuclear transport factor 2 family protein [Mesorhizobium sp.]
MFGACNAGRPKPGQVILEARELIGVAPTGSRPRRAAMPALHKSGSSMPDVIDRLVTAMNAHDLDALAALIHENYRSEQPTHPGRAFVGRAQMRANWEAMFAGIPDFHAAVTRWVQDGDTTWIEWHWSGTRSDGQLFEVRGVALFEIVDGQIVAGRLYLEDVERQPASIEDAVEVLSGRRPPTASGSTDS